MKSTAKDYFFVSIALLILFACGVVIGYRLGTRSGYAVAPKEFRADQWTEDSIGALDRFLDLTAEQEKSVRPLVENRRENIVGARERTLLSYRLQILLLHDDLMPLLTDTQRQKILKSKLLMESSIENDFANLLEPEKEKIKPR